MKIDLDEFFQMVKYLAEINKKEVEDLEFTRHGKKVSYDTTMLEDWKFTGLNNTDFIRHVFGDDDFLRILTGENDDNETPN